MVLSEIRAEMLSVNNAQLLTLSIYRDMHNPVCDPWRRTLDDRLPSQTFCVSKLRRVSGRRDRAPVGARRHHRHLIKLVDDRPMAGVGRER